MDNQQKPPITNNNTQPGNQANNEATPAAALGFQLRKGFDRLSFEADKLMRVNRIRGESNRLKDEADAKTFALGRRMVELSEAGAALEPELQALVTEIKALEAELARKKAEIEAANAEVWVAPPAPVIPPPSQPTALPHQQTPPPLAQQPETPRHEEARECPVCHAALRPGAAFCANCGYKLAP